MTRLQTLASITDVLLDRSTSNALLAETIDTYRDLLLTVSGVDLGNEQSVDHYDTGKGVAIGATWAALCVDDTIRTKRFVGGLFQAVTDLLAQRPGPVHVFYAGTGPFATLALPLMTRFTPEQLQFSCLEITDASYVAVRKTFANLGLEDFVREVIQTDAATYRLERHLPVDVMLSETMQYCLIDEMQVPIVLNLMGQLPAETIMIPECITLSLVVVDTGKTQAVVSDLGDIFTVNRASLSAYRPLVGTSDFPRLRLGIPARESIAQGPLAIRTAIRIYGEHRLDDYESGLTIPSIIGEYPDADNPLSAIDFTYQVDPSPLLWMDFILPEPGAVEA